MADLFVTPADRPLTGSVPVPVDRSIAHRALIFAGLANGKSVLRGAAAGDEVGRTRAALKSLGVELEVQGADVHVRGSGLFGLRAPSAPIECGNSETTLALLAGVLSGQDFPSEIHGHEPDEWSAIDRALHDRASKITSEATAGRVSVRFGAQGDGEALSPLDVIATIPSANAKGAVLFSALYAHGVTSYSEPLVSRDHTERIMQALGLPLKVIGPVASFDPAGWPGMFGGIDSEIPGDLSSAMFVLAAAFFSRGSEVSVRRVGTNPTRRGALEILKEMGAPLQLEPLGDSAGESFAELRIAHSELRPFQLGGERLLRATDEVPVLAALASRAIGTSRIYDAIDLERIAVVLRAFGVSCDLTTNELAVHGTGEPLRAAEVDATGDPHIAMMATVMALGARGECRIRGVDCIGERFPRYFGSLRALGAKMHVGS